MEHCSFGRRKMALSIRKSTGRDAMSLNTEHALHLVREHRLVTDGNFKFRDQHSSSSYSSHLYPSETSFKVQSPTVAGGKPF